VLCASVLGRLWLDGEPSSDISTLSRAMLVLMNPDGKKAHYNAPVVSTKGSKRDEGVAGPIEASRPL
jgi:hypothetical protein